MNFGGGGEGAPGLKGLRAQFTTAGSLACRKPHHVPDSPTHLLEPDELPPVEIVNRRGEAPLLLIGDHGGNSIPQSLGGLGVDPTALDRHIALDIGVEALGRALAVRLDAAFVRQRYSRLVIDCNRDPASAEAMPAVSDGTPVPGNAGLTTEDRQRRIAEIHAPYHAAIADVLAARPVSTTLVSLHSFTPVMAGVMRPWQIGVLHDGHNDGFALRLRGWLMQNVGLIIGDNAPYRMDATDYTVPRHAFAAARPYVELEVRQDILADAHGAAMVAALLEAGITAVMA